MKVKIEINMDNEVFEENSFGEVSRILKDLISSIEQDSKDDYVFKKNLFDVNGNKVGLYKVIED